MSRFKSNDPSILEIKSIKNNKTRVTEIDEENLAVNFKGTRTPTDGDKKTIEKLDFSTVIDAQSK